MAKYNYYGIRARADKTINRYGMTAALRVSAPGSSDPYDPGSGVNTDFPVTVVVTEFDEREKDGSLIQATDRKVIVSAEGIPVVPSQGQQLLIQGYPPLSIINVTPTAP